MRSARFHKKHASTGSKPPVQAINPHTLTSPVYIDPSKYTGELKGEKRHFLQIAAIDPGSVQCGFRVEREWETGEIETVRMHCLDFTRPLDGSDPPPDEMGPFYHYHNVVRFLEQYLPILEQCHYIGIETQMEFVPENIRLEQTFLAALLTLVKDRGSRPLILMLDGSLKTTGLGAPKFDGIKLDGTNPPAGRPNRVKTQRKKWCLAVAIHLLTERKDPACKIFDKLALDKSYDMGDCVCYTEVIRRMVQSGMYKIDMPSLE